MNNEFTIEKRKATLLAVLKALGLASVVIEYSSSGDSGQVDDIAAYLPGDEKPVNIDEQYEKVYPDHIAIRVAGKLLGEDEQQLSEKLEQFAYDAIDYANLGDWCNNDGGGGTMTILIEAGTDSNGDPHDAGTISIRHYTNYVERNYESALL